MQSRNENADRYRTLKDISHYDTRNAIEDVGKREYELGDTREPGLSLRVRKTSASWVLRGRLGPKQSIWRVGNPARVGIKAARERASAARDLLRRGIDPAPWLAEQEHGGPIERTFDAVKDGWTWPEARDKFLTFVCENRAAKTYSGYRSTLRSGDLAAWENRLLKSITVTDVRRVQEAIFARGHIPQAHLTLRTIKSCLGWLAQHSESGITVSTAAQVAPIEPGKLAKVGKGSKLGRVPTPSEIGTFGWTLAAASGTPSARLAGALILFTGQRIETVLMAKKHEFTAHESGGIWTIPAAHMKSKRSHVLPLPPVIWHVALAAMALSSADSEMVFPKTKLRRVGDSDDGHLSYGAVRDAMGDVIKPHDVRRGFATHGKQHFGLGLSDIKAILDHAEGTAGDVTAVHYELSDGQHFKWRIMQAWEKWIMQQVKAAAPGDSPAPAFLTPNPPLAGPASS